MLLKITSKMQHYIFTSSNKVKYIYRVSNTHVYLQVSPLYESCMGIGTCYPIANLCLLTPRPYCHIQLVT